MEKEKELEEKAKEKEEAGKKEEESTEEEFIPPKPKTKISIEFSRSGIMGISKAMIGSMRLSHKQVRKSV